MASTNCYPARVFTIINGAADPLHIIAKGRDRSASEVVIEAGSKGCTTIHNPVPRWSTYVHNLRKGGVSIETIAENHGGRFAGHHTRYMLTCNVAAGWKGRAA